MKSNKQLKDIVERAWNYFDTQPVSGNAKKLFTDVVTRACEEWGQYCDSCHPETFGSKIRRAYREGKLDNRIQKAEADYADGRALDRLD
jgi:hypothetical protein